jgi:hypothetical protein
MVRTQSVSQVLISSGLASHYRLLFWCNSYICIYAGERLLSCRTLHYNLAEIYHCFGCTYCLPRHFHLIKMAEVCSLKTLVRFYQTVLCDIHEDGSPHCYFCHNLKSLMPIWGGTVKKHLSFSITAVGFFCVPQFFNTLLVWGSYQVCSRSSQNACTAFL